jgi:hypothetical protein
MSEAPTPALGRRWAPLRPHAVQLKWWNASTRFNVVPAGRRSGKTELAKRKLVKNALRGTSFDNARFFASAPTRDQAKRIFWDDLKALSPPEILSGRPSESELVISYINGSQLHVLGLDKPERIEGAPWDGGVIDEVANTKASAWSMNVRPALSDRRGWCDLIGVPEGRNHYYDLNMYAKGDTSGEWGAFTWPSSDILPASEIAAAKRELDELTFSQEYGASFINFSGRAYYKFNYDVHANAKLRHLYNPKATLDISFDFNVEPGVAAISQELRLPGQYERDAKGLFDLSKPVTGTAVIGEVYIPRNSNTPAVCRKIVLDWGKHAGRVVCYGDATGGSRGSAKVEGSDWDLIEKELRPTFKERLSYNVSKSNPRERARLNAVNTRLMTANGTVRMLVDPQYAAHVAKDLDGVTLLEGGSGELDKLKSPNLTHISDALGYRVEYDFPVQSSNVVRSPLQGV